ncbi:MAG: thioredoxin family protein [Verrucomicrobia bacterium]|nr:thioredoxin family protein [Verrucomicrobiota bacterium]
MKTIVICLLTAWAALQSFAAEAEWLTDLPQAQAKAKAENKLVLMDFTGSDWCGWCIKFNKEVLATPEFAEYAAKNLVLVELDFPRKKQQPAQLKRANKALQVKYKVDGFPTFVVLNSAGNQIGKQVGYSEGGPKAFIAKLEGFKKKQS